MIAVRVNTPGGRKFRQGELVRANKRSVIVKLNKKVYLPRSRVRRAFRRLRYFLFGWPADYNYVKRNIQRDLLPLTKR
jgi:hypothetical protein